jgi:cytochrome c556
MSLPRLAVFFAAGALVAGFAATAIAQEAAAPDFAAMSHEELVEARQDAMKEDGGLLRRAGGLTGADAVAAADTLIRNYTNLPHMFPEGSNIGDSKALPVIWQDFETFTGIFAKGLQGASDMKAAAEAGDAAAYAAALQVVGGTCGECHQKFRS